MILEVAILNVIPGKETDFEDDFGRAERIITRMHGYLSHELQRCLETRNRYILLVRWASLEDHTEGFRMSAQYKEWKNLLHHYYSPFPTVEHYETIHFG